jgi:hypothetical protein
MSFLQRFQFRDPRCESKPRHRCVDHLDTVGFFARKPVVVRRNKGRLGTSDATPDALAALAAPPMSHCTAPLRIKVHDAIDVIVALIVDYYGMFAIITATIAN